MWKLNSHTLMLWVAEWRVDWKSRWPRLAVCHCGSLSSRDDADVARVLSCLQPPLHPPSTHQPLSFFLSLRPQRECSITMCRCACLQPGVTRLARVHENTWLCVSGGARGGASEKGRGVHAAPYVTWSRTSEQIDEAKAIKWEEGFASLERWLPWICEWIKKRSAWMTAWMKEQWMNTIQLFPTYSSPSFNNSTKIS